MKTFLSAALVVLLSVPLFAQKPAIKFGNVPMDALTMTTYELDSSANAVILGDYGSSTMVYSQNLGFRLSFERTIRIKILKKQGLEWANFEIPLYVDGSTDEKLVSIKGQTTNLEAGKVIETKLKNESVFKTDESENLRLVKVAFTNVKEGSVIDLNYKVSSEFFTNLQDWQFQYSIPVVVSEYRANVPDWFHYERYMQGYVSLTVVDHKTGDQTINNGGSSDIHYTENRDRWVAENVPAFNAEPFITTEKDYISKINFELSSIQFPNEPLKRYLGSWADINKTFAESDGFFAQITGNNFLKKIVDEQLAGKTTDLEKIGALHNYVKSNFSWTGAVRRYPISMKKIVDEKKGSSADLNFLLASMIEKAGLEVYPVLISTRDHGFVREMIPISSQFNGMICLVKIGEKSLLLDATEPLLPAGVLPQRCLNGRGFLVSKTGFQWVDLTAPLKSKVYAKAEFKIEPDGKFNGKLLIDRTGYSALTMRSKYLGRGEEEYLKDFSSGKSWHVSKSEIKNAKEINETFKESHELNHDSHADVSGDLIYFNPFLLFREEENPFKIEKREYPVNFGSAIERTYIGKFEVPEGFAIEEAPKNKLIALPGNAARFTYNVAQAGDQITITSILQINRDIFTQEEYPNLREFYDQVVAKQSEQIVIKKKQ